MRFLKISVHGIWKGIFVASLFFTFIHHTAFAAGEETSTEVYLGVTATAPSRLEEPIEGSPGSVTVLTAPEIDVQNPITIPEVLKDLPGVRLLESGTMGESAKLTIRGTEPSQTLILLEGVRLNSPFRGDFDLGNLLIDEITQVEVVRGAQSVLYGSDAMGGVVNLRTRRGSGPFAFSLTQEIGTEKTFREVLSVQGSKQIFDYSLTSSRTDTEGQFDRDRFGAWSFSGKFGLSLSPNSRLEWISRFQDDNKELATFIPVIQPNPNVVTVVLDENSEIKRKFSFQSVQYQGRMGQWMGLSWKAAIVNSNIDWDNPLDSAPLIPDGYFEDTDSRLVLIDLQQNLFLGNTDVFSFGIEQQWDVVDSEIEFVGFPSPPNPFQVDESRRNTAYYFQNLFKWQETFVLQAGVRVDDNSSFDSVVNPKVSSAYEFKSTRTRLRASWGEGYRAPTIQELFFPVLGNDDLEAEESRSWEAGFNQSLLGRRVVLDAVYFRIDFENLIQRSPTGVDNIGEARTQGLESFLEIVPFSKLTVKVKYTYLDAEDTINDVDLPFRSKNQFDVGFLYTPITTLFLNLDINTASSQVLPVNFNLPDGSTLDDRNPGYTRVDLSVSYHFFRKFLGFHETKIFSRVINLFDEEYQEIPGFPAPGISLLAGVTLSG